MLQRLLRSPQVAVAVIKCMMNTGQVSKAYNHHPLGCLYGECRLAGIGPGFGAVNHYRKSCYADALYFNCSRDGLVKDEQLLYHQSKIVQNVHKVMTDLNIFEPK